MKDAARYLILAFAILAVIGVLIVWKKQDRAQAFEELRERFAADISLIEDDFAVGCSSDRLVDLVEFSAVLARAGEPTILDLTGTPNLESFVGIETLPTLRSLIAIDCPKLVSADGVEGHPGLREIVLTESRNFSDASALNGLPALETVDFSGCEELESVGFAKLPALQNLYLSRCRKVSSLDVSSVSGLKQLYLDGCSELVTLTGLSQLAQLTDLDVSNSALPSLAGIDRLSSLIVLDIRNLAIDDFSGIGELPALRVLRMGGNEHIENLVPFSGMEQLREIHLEACSNFSSLKGIPPGVSQYAGFTHCPKLTSLAGVEGAPQLEQLDLTGCEALEDVSALSSLNHLVQLSLVKCRQVDDISVVEKMEKLVIVMLGGSGVVSAAVEKLDPVNKEIIFDFTVSG